MAKIKTREVDKETIKTKARTLAASQRIRNVGSKIKRANSNDNEASEQSISEYSISRVEEVTRKGVNKTKSIIGMGAKNTVNVIREKHIEQKATVISEVSNKAQSGMKVVAKRKIVNHRYNIEMRRKAVAARQIKERIEDSAKALFLGAKALIIGMAGSGTIAVVVIIICCFLGSVVYFSNEEGFDDYKPAIVAIAEDEVGNEGGKKFWKWYGFEERVEWCAIFVSWCAEQCGYLDAEIMPKFSAVDDGAECFKEKKQWASNDYIPKAGDIVFFDWESDGTLDHVGIVKSIDDEYIYTIEGNSGDICRELHYQYRDMQIYGYGIIAQGNIIHKVK